MGFQIDNGVLVKYTEEPGITEVVIPEGVTSIGDYAFEDCDSLTSIVIPQGVTSIGSEAFKRCKSLTSVIISEGVTSIGFDAFYYCSSLTSIVIPDSVTSIGDYAFRGCESLTSIIIPQGVTRIGDNAFYDCESLTSIIIPDSVTSIGDGAFRGCESLTSIIIPDSVMSIGDNTFMGCKSLKDIILPKGVKSVEELKHSSRSSLTSIIIPDNITSIGIGTFRRWYNLTSLVIPKGVTCIEQSAFEDCEKLASIIVPESVTRIGDRAFKRCKSLTSIAIPQGVTSIGNSIFDGCKSLTSLVLPQGVTSIGNYAFRECNSLTSIVIPEGVTCIGSGAFFGCKSLTSIVIPESVTSIGNSAFYGCSNLTNLVIPEGVTNIGEQAFRECNSLTNIVIPEGVTSIGGETFVYCRSLASIVLPESISSIGGNAFTCTALREIQNIDLLIRKGCKIHSATLIWLLENLWNGPEFLSEIAQVSFISSAKSVDAICERRLFENFTATADVMLELIEVNKSNTSALKKIATFALTCGGELPREKLIAIFEALKEIGAKLAVKLLEKAVPSEAAPTLEGGTGHPIEAICLERYKEPILDKGLKDNKISLKLFEGVHYKGSKTLAPAFVLKCVVFPYMQQLKELPKNIGDYQSDFIQVYLAGQSDEIADALDREELTQLMERLISECDPLEQPRILLPYCRFGSGKQMNTLAALGKKWTNWGKYLARGRRNNIVIRGAMLLSDSREAMFLVEKWGLLDEYARIRNTTADLLRDTVLTEFDLDADGSKRYDLGNAVIAASIGQDLSVSLFNETDSKEVKSLPKKGADPEKYATASEDFADLKKNIKNAVKSRVEKLKEDFVSGRELKAADWKASYLNNYVLKRVASLLAWQWKHEESAMRFMMTMDGTFIGCDGQAFEVLDEGSIAVAHPVEIPAEELECWKSLLAEKQIAQPFVQMFEPVCELDPSVVVSQYEGIELPMFLLRGLAKEGVKDIDFMYEGSWLHIQGKAITINASVISGGYFYTERAIPFDAVVSLNEVKFVGTPRAVNHEIYAMDKALIENRVRNGDIVAVEAFSRGITGKTIQDLIDVSMQVDQMEVTAWLMNYKNDHFPYTFADLEL